MRTTTILSLLVASAAGSNHAYDASNGEQQYGGDYQDAQAQVYGEQKDDAYAQQQYGGEYQDQQYKDQGQYKADDKNEYQVDGKDQYQDQGQYQDQYKAEGQDQYQGQEYKQDGQYQGGGKTIQVIVGGTKDVDGEKKPNLMYTPEYVDAEIGDVIHFIFKQMNHTVTQSTFDKPCNKMAEGVDSGFMPNSDGGDSVTWDYKVETKEAIWMYCKQKTGGHCGKGMVFSINAAKSGEKTFEAYKQLAIKLNGTEQAEAPVQGGSPPEYVASTVSLEATQTYAAPANTYEAAANPTSYIADGKGGEGSNSCSCSCMCGGSTMENAMGSGMYGGMGGMMPWKGY